ncbi:MAG: transporter, partial [Myxococcota bacterium]
MTGDRTGSAAARCALVVALLLSVLAASPARAQEAPGQLHENGMDLRLFRPAVDSKGFITVNGTEVLPHKQFSFGLMLDGGFNLLPFRGYVEDRNVEPGDRQPVDDVVDNFFTGTLHFNYGLFNRLIVGMQLPVHAVSGPRMAVPGAYNGIDAEAQSLDYQGIGDLVVHSKLRLLRAARDPIGLAAIVQFTFPTGESSKFAGEPGVGIWPSLAAEWRPHERVRLGLNAGYRLITGGGASFPVDAATEPTNANRATEPQFVDGVPTGSDVLTYDDLITFGFGASFRVADSLDIVGEL